MWTPKREESETGTRRGQIVGRRCATPGCGTQVKAGKAVCRVHERGGAGREVQAAVECLARDMTRGAAEATPGRASRVFRRRIAQGDYKGLLDQPLRQVMEQAAASQTLDDEIGALRVVLSRLLVEDVDPIKQAAAVARVAEATTRALRLQLSFNDDSTWMADFWERVRNDDGHTTEYDDGWYPGSWDAEQAATS